jgi:uracil-DNA glycosylase family 4
MADSFQNLVRSYFFQQLEMGGKFLYRPLDIETAEPEPNVSTEPPLNLDEFDRAESLDELYQTIRGCLKCALGKSRTNFVFGDGSPEADIMFVGEAPGADEDRQGVPFVGRAGQLLNKILEAMELRRQDVYIANILKCRPPNNRDPQPDEALTCEPYLHKQIRLIKPKIICCLGRIAAQRLLQTNMSLSQMRERWFDYHGTLLMVTYHPAALLRSNQYKRPLWDDMQKLLKKLEESK